MGGHDANPDFWEMLYTINLSCLVLIFFFWYDDQVDVESRLRTSPLDSRSKYCCRAVGFPSHV